MGTWGAGIFEDDVAMDVRDSFEAALAEGLNVRSATERVLEEHEEALEDIDEGPVVRLALAALQLEQGVLQPGIRDHALTVINQGQDLDRWEEAGEEAVAERRQVLEELAQRLRSASISQGD